MEVTRGQIRYMRSLGEIGDLWFRTNQNLKSENRSRVQGLRPGLTTKSETTKFSRHSWKQKWMYHCSLEVETEISGMKISHVVTPCFPRDHKVCLEHPHVNMGHPHCPRTGGF